MTGSKSIFVTHLQGGAVGWDVPMDNVSAIVAIEPDGTPQAGSEQYRKQPFHVPGEEQCSDCRSYCDMAREPRIELIK